MRTKSTFLGALGRSLRSNMLVGLFLMVPVLITLLVLQFGLRFATDWLVARRDLVAKIGIESTFGVRLLGVCIMLAGFYILGVFARNFVGRRLYQFGDRVLAGLPVIKGVYIAVRKISESLFSQRKTFFKEVVFIQYPRVGIFSLAFVTAPAAPGLSGKLPGVPLDAPCANLFIPTTPNPTSGVFIVAPRSELIATTISVSEALTFIMSAGAVKPQAAESSDGSLLDKLEAWVKDSNRTEGETAHVGEPSV
jgi:uncharacterized membrane protein